MHDIHALLQDREGFRAAMAKRGFPNIWVELNPTYERWTAARKNLDEVLAERNRKSKQIAEAKSAGREWEVEGFLSAVKNLKEHIPTFEATEKQAKDVYEAYMASLPNAPDESVHFGSNEADNLVVHERGEQRSFTFKALEHNIIGPPLGLDFATAQGVSGARFAYLRGDIARLSRALGQFMLDIHISEFGYEEIAPPLLVRDEAVFGTGQLPKFADDLFRTTDGRWLIPTAEVSLTNIVREAILDETELPLRFTALTPCFRSEAGSAGRDTKGLIRQHQFDKVELVSITTPEASEAEHERMTAIAETILDRLGLPYRRMLLCTGDMGASARKTFDLEVWLPGQGRYREISSCSNCGDWQARRMNARYRPGEAKGTRFVHTLNGSALAVGRALVAVIENYQEEDGSVSVPDMLQSYMGGMTRLTR